MKMNVTATVSHALGHWPRILPALGIQVPTVISPLLVGGGVTVSVLMTGRRGTWYCNQCGAGARRLVEKALCFPVRCGCKGAAPVASADPAVTAAAGAETDAARKNAAALAQTLMAKTRPGTGNADLT